MCEYCNVFMSFGNKEIVKNKHLDVFIVVDILHILIDGIATKKKIKYCPMCGEGLVQK